MQDEHNMDKTLKDLPVDCDNPGVDASRINDTGRRILCGAAHENYVIRGYNSRMVIAAVHGLGFPEG